ncbi:MAG: tetratricopeptide repeat protein, partial [Bacteroidota bacterium]
LRTEPEHPGRGYVGGCLANYKKAFKYYEQSAKSRYDSALLALGNFYESGSGAPQSYSFAVNYYLGAAEQGNAEANYKLGNIYYTGAGEVPKDSKKAINYYLKAFALGNKQGQSRLEKLPVQKEADKSLLGYLLYQAEKGDPESLYRIGKLYETGRDKLPQDKAKAFRNYFEAANKGNAYAQYELGKIYTLGLRTKNADVPRNMRLAVLNYIRAANGGVKEADKELKNLNIEIYIDKNNPDYLEYVAGAGGEKMGLRYFTLYKNHLTGKNANRDPEKALEYCQRAALNGYIPAMLELAKLYEKGTIVRPSQEKAFQWYNEAANLKSDSAMLVLANMYATGRGIKIDPEQAVRWYLKAAGSSNSAITGQALFQLSKYDITRFINPNDLDYVSYLGNKGDSEAQMRVAQYYYSQGDNRAVYWLTKAAGNGIVDAQRILGYIYMKGGLQVIPDMRQSVQFFYQAALQNDLESMKELAILFSQNQIPDEPDFYSKGYQLAQKYLELTAKDPSKRDAFIYKVIGDLSTTNKDYRNAVAYYTSYINSYTPQSNKPLSLVKAVNGRAIAYYLLGDIPSASTDISICLLELDQNRDHPEVRPEYVKLKGMYHYQEGRIAHTANNLVVACEAFNKARQYGTEPEAKYLQGCLTGQNKRF